MKRILQDIKTLLTEIICLIVGLQWAIRSKWDSEPLIIVLLSSLGIVAFLLLKAFGKEEVRPFVDLEFVCKSILRSPPGIIEGVSPRDENGNYLKFEGGTYFFEVSIEFELNFHNNSSSNAYNLILYRYPQTPLFIWQNFEKKMKPLNSGQSRMTVLKYQVGRPMTHLEAAQYKIDPFKDLKDKPGFVAKYQGENKKKVFFTKFLFPNDNKYLDKINVDSLIAI